MALYITKDSKELPKSAGSSHMPGAPALNMFLLLAHSTLMVSLPREPQTGPGTPDALSKCQTEDSMLSLGLQIPSLHFQELSIMIIAGNNADSASQLCLPVL